MKILKIFYYLFFVCIAVIVILLIASAFHIPGNYKVMIVQSGSMEPTIKTGAIVVVKPSPEYKVGQIVTFKSEGSNKKTVTHRIVEMKDRGGAIAFVTKGDANNGTDQREIAQKEIIGEMLFNVPYLGYVIAGAKTPYGFMAMIVFPALIIIFDEIKKIRNEIRKSRRKKSESEISELSSNKPEKYIRNKRII